MKIERFNEAKAKDDFVGITSQNVEVNVIFKINKSTGVTGYSLRAKIEGIRQIEFEFGLGYKRSGEYLLLGIDLSKEEIIKIQGEFLSHFSLFHKNINKYNL